MNADNPVTPGATGPYAYPVNGGPGQAQGGRVAPIEPVRSHPVTARHPEVPLANQQAGSQPSAPAPHHQGAVTSTQHAQTGHAATQGGTVQPGVGAGVPHSPGVSGPSPVRAPLRKVTGSTGSTEQGAVEGVGIIGGLKRFIKRHEADGEHGSESAAQLKRKGGPRRVRAMLTTVDPWSVMKLAFLLSIAAGIMFVVAASIVWSILNGMGVFESINEQITTILGPESETTFLQFVDRNKVMSVVILLSVINSILMTGLATIGAFLYNLVVKLVGGIYITLTDE